MQKSLEDFAGKEPIFVDANIFLFHAFDTNSVAIDFLKKVESQLLKAFTSSLVLEEVLFKLIVQSASNWLDRVTLSAVRGLLREGKKRKQILGPVLEYMSYVQFLRESGLGVIDLKGTDILKAIQTSAAYGLLSADAAHFAIMERNNLHHLATSDSDFQAIPNLIIWSPIS